MPVSFKVNIAPLFRPSDVSAMKAVPDPIDLSSYGDVCNRSADILNQLQLGSMPCDAPWSQAYVDLFSTWIKDGKQP
jgi:hypothetical protein